MAINKLDSRQMSHDTLLDFLAGKAGFDSALPSAHTSIEDLLESINEQLKPPMRLKRNDSDALRVDVESITRTSSETGLNRTIVPLATGIPTFTSGEIIFPNVSAGLISINPGVTKALVITGGYFRKAVIQLLDDGTLDVLLGVEGATEVAATLPKAQNMVGFAVLENVAGVIQLNAIHQFAIMDAGLQIQEDGVDVTRRPILNFRGDVIVVDTGERIEVTIPSGEANLVNNEGNSIAKLQPTATELTLQSPDLNKWEFFVNNNGTIRAEDSSIKPVSNIKLLRNDGLEASFNVDNAGAIDVEVPAAIGTSLVDHVFLESPEGTMWEMILEATVTQVTLESPDGEKWDITATDDGELFATNGSTKDVTPHKFQRADLTEVSFSITNDGELQIENPAEIGTVLIPRIILQSPDTTLWDLLVTNDDELQLSTDNTIGLTDKTRILMSNEHTTVNYFTVQNDKCEDLFVVREFETGSGALAYLKIIDATQLASVTPPPSIAGTAAFIMYDTGSSIRPIFYDNTTTTWRYFHDNSAV